VDLEAKVTLDNGAKCKVLSSTALQAMCSSKAIYVVTFNFFLGQVKITVPSVLMMLRTMSWCYAWTIGRVVAEETIKSPAVSSHPLDLEAQATLDSGVK
jgi:hypothetical protein